MGNITLSIPNEILKQMKKHKEIKWSKVARQKIVEYLNALDLLDEISDLSEEDAIKLGLKIHHQEKNAVWEQWKKANLKNAPH